MKFVEHLSFATPTELLQYMAKNINQPKVEKQLFNNVMLPTLNTFRMRKQGPDLFKARLRLTLC